VGVAAYSSPSSATCRTSWEPLRKEDPASSPAGRVVGWTGMGAVGQCVVEEDRDVEPLLAAASGTVRSSKRV
jgi:hypothetical protein